MTHYRKDKIKRVLLKVINITSYILSLLFIIFAIYGCATSSKEGSQSQKANIQRRLDTKEDEFNGIQNYLVRNGSNYYLYNSFLTSDKAYDFLIDLYSLSGTTSSYSQSVNYSIRYSYSTDTTYYNDTFDTMAFYWSSSLNYRNQFLLTRSTSSYPKTSFSINFNSSILGTTIIKRFSNSSTNSQGAYGLYMLDYLSFTGLTTDQVEIFDNFIETLRPVESGGSGSDMPIENTSLITLGDNFNPLALISDNLYNGGLIYYNTSASDNVLTLTGLSFESNGQTFDTIEITSRTCSGLSFSFDDGETILDVISGGNGLDLKDYHFFYRIKYSYNNDEVVVYPMQSQFENNGSSIYINLSRYKWINDEYRYLTIINDEETPMRNGMTTKELLLMRGSSTNAVIGAYNPASLLTSGFNALANLLNIAILPGITLGLLLFIPLIVLVIITIFKMVKK